VPQQIDGVALVPLVTRADDRGFLIEIIRATDEHFSKFGQVYVVGDPVRGTVRAFHKHAVLWDYFFIVKGSAKFVLVDDRPGSDSQGSAEVFVLGERNPALLVVPPGVYHGWMSLEDRTLMISTASEVYDRENPDEVRIAPDHFGDFWTVKGR
jgi:dTDP-4-dehydrorhamnose 3,5-epimerase